MWIANAAYIIIICTRWICVDVPRNSADSKEEEETTNPLYIHVSIYDFALFFFILFYLCHPTNLHHQTQYLF